MRVACAVLMLVALNPVTSTDGRQAMASSQVGQNRSADLEEILVNGLRARNTEERAFIGRVIALVDDGALTEGLVKAIFRKARAYSSRFPMPYFERIVRKVAAENGVEI